MLCRNLSRRACRFARPLSFRSTNETNTPTIGKQHVHRPLSPYLTIYQPQLTWLMSIAHRMTGTALTVGIYGFGLYYAIASPGRVTDTMVAAVLNTPDPLVLAGKIMLAWPFFYHTLNGIRHLVWDCGYALSIRSCYISGWMVNAGTILFTTWVALI